MTSFPLNLEDELLRKVKQKAKELNVDENSLIVKAVQDFLFLGKVSRIRDRMGKLFREKGINSEDDIYELVS